MSAQQLAELLPIAIAVVTVVCKAVSRLRRPPETVIARRRQKAIERLDRERRLRLRTTLRRLPPGTAVRDRGPDGSELIIRRESSPAPRRGDYWLW